MGEEIKTEVQTEPRTVADWHEIAPVSNETAEIGQTPVADKKCSILRQIQQNLKVPKSQYNEFGKYRYRTCEDILEAVKPMLDNAILLLSDDIVLIGNRFYVKATAIFQEPGHGTVTVTSFAREALDKKGMDDAQITGSCSSYARKYALCGLFLIDSDSDPDKEDNTIQVQPQKTAQPKQNYQAVQYGQPTTTIRR